MAIDRIGGKGAPPAPTEAGSAGPTAPAAPFEINRPDATAPAEKAGPSHLDRLRAGEIDAATYVELKVDEATRHLTNLRPEDLETIRAELRHRMLADPSLSDLVQAATGVRLPVPEE